MPQLPPTVRRWVIRISRLLVILYVVLSIVIYFFQTWLIYPGRSTAGTPQAPIPLQRGEELVFVTSTTGERIALLFTPAFDGRAGTQPIGRRPTLIYFYGNGETIERSRQIIDDFRRLGCNVLTVDYPGYGMSGGSPSEKAIFTAADAAWQYAISRADVDPAKLIPVGRSLGGAAAIHLASTQPAAALVTFSTFSSMLDMAHKLLPIFPTRWLLRDRFESEKAMPAVKCPCFIAHGTADELIPVAMAARLTAAAAGLVTRYNVAGAGHNDVYDAGGPELMRALKAFIDKTVR